jgi:hypothetical protein
MVNAFLQVAGRSTRVVEGAAGNGPAGKKGRSATRTHPGTQHLPVTLPNQAGQTGEQDIFMDRRAGNGAGVIKLLQKHYIPVSQRL